MADKPPVFDAQVGGGHYKTMRVQPIHFGMLNSLNACQMLALRYLARDKGGLKRRLEERMKAIHCIEMEIEFIKADMALPTEERVAIRRSLIAKLDSEIREIQHESTDTDDPDRDHSDLPGQ